MTVTVGNKGGGAAGTTSVTLSYPTVGATAIAAAFVGSKPHDSTPTVDNSDWVQLCTGTSGTVANGNGTGSVRATAWYQIGNVNGGASDVFSVTSGSPTQGRIWEITKTGTNWATPVGDVLSDTDETGTTVSAAGTTTLDIMANDFLILSVIMKDDVIDHTSQELSIPGCTLGSITWDTKATTTTGNDLAQHMGVLTVSSGVATGVATYTGTSDTSGASATAVALVRFRETEPPIGSVRVVQNVAVRRASFY